MSVGGFCFVCVDGRKEMFYLMTHSTFYLWLYDVKHGKGPFR